MEENPPPSKIRWKFMPGSLLRLQLVVSFSLILPSFPIIKIYFGHFISVALDCACFLHIFHGLWPRRCFHTLHPPSVLACTHIRSLLCLCLSLCNLSHSLSLTATPDSPSLLVSDSPILRFPWQLRVALDLTRSECNER